MSDELTIEPLAGWIAPDEKLRCHMVLDDGIGQKLSPRAGPAYFRAFIVEDRETHRISMKFRYKYINPDERNWYRLPTEKTGDEGVRFLVAGMRKVLLLAATLLKVGIRPDHISEHYPPDDNGDWGATVIWLDMHDLIEITEVKEV